VSTQRKNELVALIAGLLFGVGLVLSGMTLPSKVIGFLDVFSGGWDPSLALVMGGAIAVHAVVYRLVKGRASPILAGAWSVPSRKDIDSRLLFGASLFGLGWGLGGFCPGPGLVSLSAGASSSIVFVASMLGAMFAFGKWEEQLQHRKALGPAPQPAMSATPD
jgi:uncharacterized membrane protein YedE/YeeE